ncbi:MAG: hypothetical protein IKR57_06010 [Bacilli bacterium]|nr:hypothetical protein [Bacilli bacterium]
MKLKRKIIFFLALMSLFYCITLMQDTYAKYVSSAEASANLTIARWNILVNNQDILQNSNFTNTISPEFLGTTHIRSGVIAPTAEGTFEIDLNGTSTDVSFTYTISLEENPNNTVTDLAITKYEIDGVEYQYDEDDPITEDILLNDINKTRSIVFYVEWNDDAQTQTMNNAADTAATYNGTAAFNVNVNVIQKQ